MSIKLMSAIFETEFRDLPYIKDGEERNAKASTCKLLLLAIADHANDYGESAYPGYDRLEIKTALSRQGISDTLHALTQNGLLSISEKPSRLQTNSYTILLSAFPIASKDIIDESSHLTGTSQVTLPARVKPLDLNHSLTTNKPSIKRSAEKPAKPSTPPEVKLFREVTERYPNKINYPDVVLIIQGVSKRLGRDCSADDLRPFYAAWCAKGFKPVNLAWLSWAESGIIPEQRPIQKLHIPEPKGLEAGRLFLERHGVNSNV